MITVIPHYESKGTGLFVGVDYLGEETLYWGKPEYRHIWWWPTNDEKHWLRPGTIKKLIGRSLEYSDGVVEL